MKTYKKPAASKLLIRFDNELKNILIGDLNSFMDRNPFFARSKQDKEQHKLSVA